MTAEQKYLFDLNGYLLIPGVLSSEQCRTLREFVVTLRKDPQSLAETDRYSFSGPASELLDHPVLVGILRAITTGENHNIFVENPEPLSAEEMPGFLETEDAYPFRFESSFSMVRKAGEQGQTPHAYPRLGPLFCYQCTNGKIYAGLVRVAWELNAIGPDDAGTTFIPGSHKANFTTPRHLLEKESPMMRGYTCPEGSLVLFTEALTHAGAEWKNPDWPRIAILNCYGPISARYHRLQIPAEVIAAMPPKRRTLFRGVWGHGTDEEGNPSYNTYYSLENRAY